MDTKQCFKCQENKSLNNFYKNKRKSDGLNYLCKECDKKYKYNYYKKWRQQPFVKEQRKKYYKENKHKISVRQKYYNILHKEIRNERSKQHYLKNKEKYQKKHKEWRKENKERESVNHRIWKNNHKESVAIYNKKRRILKYGASGFHTEQEWQQKKKEYNYRCAYCGIHESILKNKYKCKKWWKLTEDHVIALTKGGSDYITNIVPACISCNTSKNNTIICRKNTTTIV